MKLIKKIAAIMFAFMMVVSMSCNVKADEGTSTDTTGTLTINDVKENQTYKLYKILDLESFSGKNYSYKVAKVGKNFSRLERVKITLALIKTIMQSGVRLKMMQLIAILRKKRSHMLIIKK